MRDLTDRKFGLRLYEPKFLTIADKACVTLSLIIPPTHVIHSFSSSVLQPHCHSFPSYRAPWCGYSPAFHIVLLFPLLALHLLYTLNYLSFTRSQLKSCLLQEHPHHPTNQAPKFISTPSGAEWICLWCPIPPSILSLLYLPVYFTGHFTLTHSHNLCKR